MISQNNPETYNGRIGYVGLGKFLGVGLRPRQYAVLKYPRQVAVVGHVVEGRPQLETGDDRGGLRAIRLRRPLY
jgi:hypothetical protein